MQETGTKKIRVLQRRKEREGREGGREVGGRKGGNALSTGFYEQPKPLSAYSL